MSKKFIFFANLIGYLGVFFASCLFLLLIAGGARAQIVGKKKICINDTTTFYDTAMYDAHFHSNITPTLSVNAIGHAWSNTATGPVRITAVGHLISDSTLRTDTFYTYVMHDTTHLMAYSNNVCVGGSMFITNDSLREGNYAVTNPSANIVDLDHVSANYFPLYEDSNTAYFVTHGYCSYYFVSTLIMYNDTLPTAIFGDKSTVCVNDTAELHNGTDGGTWSSSSVSISLTPVATMCIVTGVSAGSASITYTVNNTCGYHFFVYYLNVTATVTPIVYTDTTLCVGGSTIFSESATGGTWSSSNTAIVTVSSTGSVSGTGEGYAVITYSIIGDACTSFETQGVQVQAPASAIAGSNRIAVGQTVTYTDNAAGGTWSSSNIGVFGIDPIAGIGIGLAAGSATVSYDLTNRCGVSSAVITTNVIYNSSNLDSCHWQGIATPVPCPDFRPWKNTRDDQLDLSNNLLSNILIQTSATQTNTAGFNGFDATTINKIASFVVNGGGFVDSIAAGDSISLLSNYMVFAISKLNGDFYTNVNNISGLTPVEIAYIHNAFASTVPFQTFVSYIANKRTAGYGTLINNTGLDLYFYIVQLN